MGESSSLEGSKRKSKKKKQAIRGAVWAPPGGYIEPGERPLRAARREWREETGCTAKTGSSLGRFRVDANRGAGHACLYLGLEARCVGEPTADDLQVQSLLLLTRRELESALDAGRVPCLAWSALVGLGLRRLDRIERRPG